METQLLTLSKIFTERLFRIPDYQRGYAWQEKHLNDFWYDIEQLGPDQNHYTGVLTLETVPKDVHDSWKDDKWIIDAKGFQPFYVVDGQQRLTTAIVLIECILETVDNDLKLNFTDIADIKRKFIFDSKDGQISRSYIFGYEDSDPSFFFLKTEVFQERASGAVEETIYTENLKNAKLFFLDKMSTMTHHEIEFLYRKITQNVLFNIFSISKEVDTCVAFETMNNRGKPLSNLELLKNRLIYLSIKFDEEPHERARLRRAVNDAWRTLYHNLGRNKDRPLSDDHFLNVHYLIHFTHDESFENKYRIHRSEANAGSLLEKMFSPRNVGKLAKEEDRVSLQIVYNYVNNLEDAIKTWYYLFNPHESHYSEITKIWLEKIDRLGNTPFLPLLLVFMQKVEDVDKQVAFLQAVERYTFFWSLADRYYIDSLFRIDDNDSVISLATNLNLNTIGPDKVTKTINDASDHLAKHPNYLKTITDHLRSVTFYKWRAIRYFLYEYDEGLKSRSKTNNQKIDWNVFAKGITDFVTLEHIYPQTARHEDWTSKFKEFTPKQRSALRDSLGNLLPLSRPKNASLSNVPFSVKVEGRTTDSSGYRFGSYAEIEVSRETEWNAEKIVDRGLKLLDFMEKRWKLSLGSRDKKLDILGLDFMNNSKKTSRILAEKK